MVSGNKLVSIPEEISRCKDLMELVSGAGGGGVDTVYMVHTGSHGRF